MENKMGISSEIDAENQKPYLSGLRQRISRKTFGRTLGALITAAQIFADIFTVLACYVGSHWFYSNFLQLSSRQNLEEYALVGIGMSIIYVTFFDRAGLYKREVSLLNIKELRGIFRSGVYAAALILSALFYVRSTSFSRITVTLALITTPPAIYLQRQLFYRLHIIFHQKGWSQKRVLIYGVGRIGIHLVKRLFESPSLGYLPVGFLDDAAEKHGKPVQWKGIGPKGGLRVLGGEDFLRSEAAKDVDLVLIALPSATFERNQQLVDLCSEIKLEYSIVPNVYEKLIQSVEMFELGGIPLFRKRQEKKRYLYLITKRLLDFFITSTLIVVFSPLVLAFGILIKLDSPGPVFFKQKRVGYRGRLFSIYKFRTMKVDAPKYAVTPNSTQDPRITRIGKWLRRTSLDELPQLFNVFRGDMSLVGPRPEMPFIAEQYTSLAKMRLEVKPGITGVWQISAVRGEPIHQNMEYDLFYLQNRSLLFDFAILTKTALSVIRGIGAV